MKRKYTLLALLLSALYIALPPAVYAQTVAKQEMLEKLFEIPAVKDTVLGKQMFQPISQLMERQIELNLQKNKNISSEKRKVISSAAGEVFKEEMVAFMQEMLPVVNKIYADTFSYEEIEAMYEFYQNEHAISMMEKMPSLMAKMMPEMLSKQQQLTV
ncbi:MAG: DUF2059 domain-containing protein, partial [Alphaproteobacteria bacterium]|nr:DUF2059 domain-containing protein [Alphaproteobacteria bacterium]